MRAGDTVPTWLARTVRRPEWKAPPRDSVVSSSPYQLSSMTVPSGASSSSDSWRPAEVALVCTTRSLPTGRLVGEGEVHAQ